MLRDLIILALKSAVLTAAGVAVVAWSPKSDAAPHASDAPTPVAVAVGH